ncbi:hypothetical protein [Rosistilla oblonga]|uniref:hypothetical protein n=1 Tax=Rosistilla oblonga TaxID=2527990 RepID=UPI003A977760
MNQQLKPTNVKFVDRLLGGGTKPEGVYGILSPTGVGKSTLACMIAANSATGSSIFRQESPGSLPCVLFDLHNGRSLSEQRIVSHVGRICREQVWYESQELLPYEEERKGELPIQNGSLLNSCERAKLARDVLNWNLYLCSDCDEAPNLSDGATPNWISQELTQAAQHNGGLGGIVIDGARHVWYASEDKVACLEHEFLEQLVAQFCRRLAKRFQCPVWITHQIRHAQGCAPPTTQLTHRDAADCKSFANGMDACLVMGTRSDPDDVFSIQCTKGDKNIVSRERILLKHDDVFSSIVEAKDFVEDRKNKTWKKVPGLKPLLDDNDKNHIEDLLKQLR